MASPPAVNRSERPRRAAPAAAPAPAPAPVTAATGGLPLPAERLLAIYRTMRLSRHCDEKMLVLLKQGKSFFHIGGSGHEAAQAAAVEAMQPGKDWWYPYYRGICVCLSVGMKPEEVFLSFLARAADPNSGGRQMPNHYGHKALRIVSQSSPTGTQFLQAVGCAMGARREGVDEVVFVSAGEGTTSQGDFHEALNWAARDKAPALFFIENNHFAISVPIEQQTAGGSVYKLAAGYEGLARFHVDGTDFFETLDVVRAAVAAVRGGAGPALVEADVVRLLPHSSSDDHRKYRSREDLARDLSRDPLRRFRERCLAEGVAGEAEFAAIDREAHESVERAAAWAESQPMPERATATRHVWCEPEDQPRLAWEQAPASGGELVFVDAINRALDEELARNPRMIVYGQDVAGGKGGVFTATRGLTARHGPERVFNAPLAESSIVGTAIGYATRGDWKPVVEIQFGDYVWTAMMQIRNELASMRYRSNNAWACPAVIRVPVGGYIHGGLCHSQNIESFFAHIPGLTLAHPSTAYDAHGLLKTACRLNDPVLFLEHKALYRQNFARTVVGGPENLIPFGKAALRREGSDVTALSYGLMSQRCLEAARALEREGVSVEVLDLRTLIPWDVAACIASVRKTGRCLVVHEDALTAGFGGEIAATIGERAFRFLDAPVRRVAGKECHIPVNWELEAEVLPRPEQITAALRDLARF
ncbi:MAG: dehydrogenase E1 component subunit alpha/beta [Planctomycetes bacterium]|nr:dehydrogenase E1 component subunit alpha/beta [Planctomycetota bacterium]